jgi:curved DNA-binding protein CbpA
VNFYDELGVARSASTDEIRQAYKTLARLVHPDQCADEKLRSLAEIQMKRLNQIVALLADPEERRRYDAALEAKPLVPIPEPAHRPQHVLIWEKARAAWVWVLAAGIGVAGLMFFLPRDAGNQTVLPPSEEPRGQTSRSPKPTAQPRVKADPQPAGESEAALLAELRATRRELEQLRQEQAREPGPDRQTATRRGPAPSKPAPAKVAAQMTEPSYVVPPTTQRVLPPPEPPAYEVRAPKQPVHRFEGHWFYVRGSQQPKTNGLYPPEYIELRLTEDSGTLRGRYQARYHVPDQAISPEVAFEFEGPSNAPSVQLPWKGPGRAAGDVTLKLVSDTSIEVSWRANRLSDQLGLTAGKAILVRELVRE